MERCTVIHRKRRHGDSRSAKGGGAHSQGREDEETQLCPGIPAVNRGAELTTASPAAWEAHC